MTHQNGEKTEQEKRKLIDCIQSSKKQAKELVVNRGIIDIQIEQAELCFFFIMRWHTHKK